MRCKSMVAAAATLLLTVGSAHADIDITLGQNGDGSNVVVVGSGSGTVTGTGTPNRAFTFFGPFSWDFIDFGQFLPPSLLPLGDGSLESFLALERFSGELTNVTTGTSVALRDFVLQDFADPDSDTNTPEFDDFSVVSIRSNSSLAFTAGDEFTIEFEGLFDTGELTPADLILGDYTNNPALGRPEEVIFGEVRLAVTNRVIPEPASVALIALSAVGLSCLRRR